MEWKCSCGPEVKVQEYQNQVWVPAPPHMPKEKGYCLDRCVAQEVMQLWKDGITTTGCCCGHNAMEPYIGVIDQDIPSMKAKGYVVHSNPNRPSAEDSFYPKSIKQTKL